MNRLIGLLSLSILILSVGCSAVKFGADGTTSTSGFEIGTPDPAQPPSDPLPPPSDPADPKDKQSGDKPPHDGNDQAGSCRNVQVKDVVLNVKAIELMGDCARQSLSFSDSSFSLVNDPLIITPTADIQPHQIRLILNETGNKVIGIDDKEYDLKTPSQQESGLKILVQENISLLANQSYTVLVDLDLNKQIVHAGSKCLLKPVLRAKEIAPVDSCRACFACIAAGGTIPECTPPCNPDCF